MQLKYSVLQYTFKNCAVASLIYCTLLSTVV